MASKTKGKPAASLLQYVAIGQVVPGGVPEPLNTFDDMKTAAACAGQFVANNTFPSAAWVETIEIKPVTLETPQTRPTPQTTSTRTQGAA